MLDEVIEVLTEQLIKENFENKHQNDNKKIVITKEELYQFSIKLVKLVKKVYEDENS